MGNAIMDDYYAVFDLTPADERKQNYIQFGIGKKALNHQFDKEQGPMENILYDANGYESEPYYNEPVETDPNHGARESMRKELDSGFGTMMFMILISIFATVICLCHLRAKKKEEDIENDRKHSIRRSTLQAKKKEAENVQRRKSLEEIKYYNVAESEKDAESLTEKLDGSPKEIKFK